MTTGDRVIRGDGTAESAWQAWPGLAQLPTLSLDELLPADARLVVVAPHPDDELLACGGLLALHAARGGAWLLLAVTDGESSHPGSAVWSPPQLADARWAERRRGLDRLLGRPPMTEADVPPPAGDRANCQSSEGARADAQPPVGDRATAAAAPATACAQQADAQPSVGDRATAVAAPATACAQQADGPPSAGDLATAVAAPAPACAQQADGQPQASDRANGPTAPTPPWIRLGLPDGAVAEAADRLEADLRQRLRPTDRVVATWRFDGHADHEASGAAAARACAAIGCRLVEAPVWMWHWAAPDDPRVPWPRLHALALPAGVADRKRLAMAEHATQWTPRDTGDGPVLGPGMRERLQRDVEYFFL